MRNRASIDTTAILITGAALAAMVVSLFEFGPHVDRDLHRVIGKALAKEALSVLKPGGKISVIARDIATFRHPGMEILLNSFTREVRRAGAVVASTHFVQVDPLRPVEVPPGDFFELIRRASENQVIVSFMGPPVLNEEQRNQLGRIKPKIVAFCSGNLAESVDLHRLFEAGLLHAAIVNRLFPPAKADPPAKNPLTFDQLYLIVTARNLSQLPSRFGSAE